MAAYSRAGSGLRKTFSLIRSASSDEHPGQHDVKQEGRAAWRICSQAKQRSSSQTTGPPAQNKGAVHLKLGISLCRMRLIWNVLNMSIRLQTQSTLQMTGSKAASKKEKAEPATDQQPKAPPPASNSDDAENKR